MASYHHGDLRAAILEAARRALDSEAGGVSLRALAVAVGVSPNAPYRHFATKESLLAALAAQGFDDLAAGFKPLEGAAADVRLEGCLAAYLAFARANPGLYRLMFGRKLDVLAQEAELGEHAKACFFALMAVVAQVLERPMEDPAVRQGAAAAWAVSHGAAMLDIDQATQFLAEEDRPTAARLCKMVLFGMAG